MSTKTISLRVEAYERLRRARAHAGESFSDVVMRARWADQTATGAELLRVLRERGPLYAADEIDGVEDLSRADAMPDDKWSTG